VHDDYVDALVQALMYMRGSVEADRWIAHQAEAAAAPDWNPATALLREVRALGYPGGYSILRQHLARGDPWPAIASIATG
jgi:hypothetical protein